MKHYLPTCTPAPAAPCGAFRLCDAHDGRDLMDVGPHSLSDCDWFPSLLRCGACLFHLAIFPRELSGSVDTHVTHFKRLCNIPINRGARIYLTGRFQPISEHATRSVCVYMQTYAFLQGDLLGCSLGPLTFLTMGLLSRD